MSALYTTQLQAGLGLIDETRSLLELWQFDMTASELNVIALESGHFSNNTARRLRNIVSECFAPRYLSPDASAAKHLKQLLGKASSATINQLMFLYTCRANRILADFVREVYWDRYEGGYELISKQDGLDFINRALDDGKMTRRWSDSTVSRVASYLLGSCADFGLLGQRSGSGRKMSSFQIDPSVATFLAYDLHFQGMGDNAVVAHPDWMLFGLEHADVRDKVKRMALKGLVIFQSAGDISHISWNHKTMEEVADVIAEG